MSKQALIAAGGGAAGALLATAAFSGLPGGVFLAYLAPLPLLLVGLSRGLNALGLAAAAGILVCVILGGVASAAVFAALSALPSWLIVHSALKQRLDAATGKEVWQPLGHIVAVLSLVVGVTMLSLGLTAAGGESMAATVRGQLQDSFTASLPHMDPEMLATLVDQLAPLFLGFSAAIWLFLVATNGMLAENSLAARNWAIRPRPRWSAFALPDWFAWPLVITAIIALVPSGDLQYLARNLVLVFAAAYLFQGLATVHTISQGMQGQRLLLAALYFVLFIFSVIAAPLLAALGMIDQWAGVRRRIAGQSRGWE